MQREKYLSSANVISASVFSATDAVSQYFNLATVNKELAEENAQLRAQLKQSYISGISRQKQIKDSSLSQQYTYQVAKVINNSTNRRKNYLTLNRGEKHGVKKDMAVISSGGIVGIVDDVSEHFCTVVSFLNTNYRVSAKFKKNNYFGSCYWVGGPIRKAFLGEIPYHVDVSKGDEIVTNSFSSIYPSGIPIGTVSDFSVSDEENFYDITIDLAVDFKNLEYVYIVGNLLRTEQVALENDVVHD